MRQISTPISFEVPFNPNCRFIGTRAHSIHWIFERRASECEGVGLIRGSWTVPAFVRATENEQGKCVNKPSR